MISDCEKFNIILWAINRKFSHKTGTKFIYKFILFQTFARLLQLNSGDIIILDFLSQLPISSTGKAL